MHEGASDSEAANAACIRCGKPFSCNPGPECWCAKEPSRPMQEDAAGCYCPACLAPTVNGAA